MIYCPNCSPKTLHCITGTTVFHNGNSIQWKKFVSGDMTLEKAKQYAIHIEESAWFGCAKEVKCDE